MTKSPSDIASMLSEEEELYLELLGKLKESPSLKMDLKLRYAVYYEVLQGIEGFLLYGEADKLYRPYNIISAIFRRSEYST